MKTLQGIVGTLFGMAFVIAIPTAIGMAIGLIDLAYKEPPVFLGCCFALLPGTLIFHKH